MWNLPDVLKLLHFDAGRINQLREFPLEDWKVYCLYRHVQADDILITVMKEIHSEEEIARILKDPASGFNGGSVRTLGLALLRHTKKSQSPNAAFSLMRLNQRGFLTRRLFSSWLQYMEHTIKQETVTFVVGKLKELYKTKAEVVAALDVAEFQWKELAGLWVKKFPASWFRRLMVFSGARTESRLLKIRYQFFIFFGSFHS